MNRWLISLHAITNRKFVRNTYTRFTKLFDGMQRISNRFLFATKLSSRWTSARPHHYSQPKSTGLLNFLNHSWHCWTFIATGYHSQIFDANTDMFLRKRDNSRSIYGEQLDKSLLYIMYDKCEYDILWRINISFSWHSESGGVNYVILWVKQACPKINVRDYLSPRFYGPLFFNLVHWVYLNLFKISFFINYIGQIFREALV